MRENNVLTRDDIAIDHDMQIDSDEGREIIAYVETWFDVDRKFHIDTASDDDTSKGYRNPKQAAGGDVCERRLWRMKRAKRRGSGQNSVSGCEQRILDPTSTWWGSSKPFPHGFDGYRNRGACRSSYITFIGLLQNWWCNSAGI